MKTFMKELGWELRRMKLVNVSISISSQMLSCTLRILCCQWTFLFLRISWHLFRCWTLLYSYFDDIEQLGTGQVYIFIDVSKEVGPRVSLGPCPFDFSCLLRSGVVENVLSEFTLRHGATIVFSGSQKQTGGLGSLCVRAGME